MARSRKRTKALPLWLVVVLVAIACIAYFYLDKNKDDGGSSNPSGFENMANAGDGVLNLYFVNVGQGDCIIIEFPDNKTMIIDSGENSAEDELKDFIDTLEIETFDYMLLTHADSDHVGNMDFVFENYQINKVFRPYVLSTHDDADMLESGINQGFSNSNGGNVKSSNAYFNFLLGLQNEPNCSDVFFNKDADFSGVYTDGNGVDHAYTFDFLTPTANQNSIKYSDANDYSPIVVLSYNGAVIVLTGDAETEAEAEFVEYYKNSYPDCDVLKIGHHGSETSSQQAFLNAVKPEYAIIQCGINNSYNHPRQAVLDRLNAMGTSVYRNDTNGNIAISVTLEDGYKISSQYIYCENTDVSKNYIGGDKD